MGYLVLVRHGESRWNSANKFTGWVDVPLNEKGIYEALVTAEELERFGIDVAFTSTLMRGLETLNIILAKQDYTGVLLHTDSRHKMHALHPKLLGKKEIPIYRHWALNERFYGKLQGMNKDAARRKWGKQKVFTWRRSWDVKPPGGESLKDTYTRTIPYFKRVIMPAIKKGQNVLVSAHGNSLRAIIKLIDGLSNEEIPHLELATGKPYIYHYKRGKLVKEHEHEFTRPVHWHPKK